MPLLILAILALLPALRVIPIMSLASYHIPRVPAGHTFSASRSRPFIHWKLPTTFVIRTPACPTRCKAALLLPLPQAMRDAHHSARHHISFIAIAVTITVTDTILQGILAPRRVACCEGGQAYGVSRFTDTRLGSAELRALQCPHIGHRLLFIPRGVVGNMI
ncbi:hypothetical protein EVG20_g11556 [Dentipellis fragilis]|uniref:Secreted protein n=1 Tax=Dentipellis fragilis TaxID=205917 RepID=A0A4Y9XJS3_9AGAM|nr:hypothetical protein EVG20_g11556 [Dentipellis fragilis]